MTKLNFLSEKFDRRNPLRRKFFKLVHKVERQLTFIMMLCILVGIGAGTILDIYSNQRKRQAYKDEVKERCSPVHNELNGSYVTTTYECPDGVTYSFEEKI